MKPVLTVVKWMLILLILLILAGCVVEMGSAFVTGFLNGWNNYTPH